MRPLFARFFFGGGVTHLNSLRVPDLLRFHNRATLLILGDINSEIVKFTKLGFWYETVNIENPVTIEPTNNGQTD